MTSTSLAIRWLPQTPGPHPLGQLFVRTKAADVRLVWVECPRHGVEQPERAQNPKEVLDTHPSISAFQADDRHAADTGAVGELSLRQASQLPPGLHRGRQFECSAPDGRRHRPSSTISLFPIVIHVRISIAF
jgi:hypothetical protein